MPFLNTFKITTFPHIKHRSNMTEYQRRNEGGKWGAIPRAPKIPNNVTSTFFSSRFAFERPQVRTWGRQTCFLSRAPSNLVTPLPNTHSTKASGTEIQRHDQGCGIRSPVIRLRLLAISIIRLRLQLRLRPDYDLQLY